jgi:hypothetical protein
MRKLLLMIIAVAFMASYVFAQGTAKDTRGQFQLGLKAGANFANVYDTQGEEFRADGKLGFVGGAFLTIPLSTMFGIQPEVLFSQKGFKATGNVLGRRYELTRTTNYLDVPLMLSVKPIQYVTVMAGPQFSYLIRQKDTFANANDSFDVIQEFKNDNIRKNIMGVIAGIDVNVSHLVVGARAGWDLSTNHGDGSSVTPRYKNAWLQATLGYRFL